MFHVHSDQRTRHSATKIAQSLNDLIEAKDFADITITDIQRKTGVARTTFYRSFDNLSDVLEWECDQQLSQIFNRYHGLTKFPNEQKILHDYLVYWTQHSQLLAILIKIQRMDIIYKYQYRYAEKMVAEYGPIDRFSKIPLNYFLAVRTSFILSIILTWVDNGQIESVSQLQAIAEAQAHQLGDIGHWS